MINGSINQELPLVGVIVPVYNVGKYISRCLESLMTQTYPALHILLVDDGSTDESGSVCDDYVRRFPQFKVIHKEHSGVADTRNTGLDRIEGDYIGFVDPDDYIPPDYFRILVEMSMIHNAEIAQCGFLRLKESELDPGFPDPDYSKALKILNREQALSAIYSNRHFRMTVLWNKIFRRQLFEGLRFPDVPLHEDNYITWQLINRITRMAETELPLYRYIQRSASLIGKKPDADLIHLFESLRGQINFYQTSGMRDLAQSATVFLEKRLRKSLLQFAVKSDSTIFFRLLKKEYRKHYPLFKNIFRDNKKLNNRCRIFSRMPAGIFVVLCRFSKFRKYLDE
jgi:glycosyltransferase involved in cell wall biosynthesis